MAWRVAAGFLRSAVGMKAVMALSGIALFGFVLAHMVGNLKLYAGPVAFNHYAEWLREIGTPGLPHAGALWIARAVLLTAVALHIWAAWRVTMQSRRARPVAYARRRNPGPHAGYAARTMRWGGVIILLFVLYHLAHFTFGWRWAHPDFVRGDVYHNVVTGFGIWWVSAFYIVAQVALGLHLYHGLWSLFQTLGRPSSHLGSWPRTFATLFAWLITIGNISFPVAVLAGWVA